MFKNKLWLTEEREKQPYECNRAYFASRLEIIELNKQIIDKIYLNDPLTAQEMERCAIVKASIGAPMIENDEARKNMPPYTDEFNAEYRSIVSGFEEAQSELFHYLELKDMSGKRKFPIIDHSLLPFIFQKLVKGNDNLSQKEKSGFRETDSIQLSFCKPTSAEKITSEVGRLFVEYVNCDVDWNNVDIERPINFENIAKAHAQFVRIQPFSDANKRMAFILTNGMLKLQGLCPIAICETKEESEIYMNALKEAIVKRDATYLADYFVDCEIKEQRQVINAATISAVENEIFGKKKLSTPEDPNDPAL